MRILFQLQKKNDKNAKRKKIGAGAAVFGLCLLTSFPSYAGVWKNEVGATQTQWWYDNQDGTFAQNGWYWIDGNQDSTAECYYFDEQGWLVTDGITPDGWQVNRDGAWTENGIVKTRAEESTRSQSEETMRIEVRANGKRILFELNNSAAAKDLYNQLPMSIEVSDYSNNEKIFYPAEELNTTGAPLAQGGAGTLAYYRPWGNVVMFYGDFHSNHSLYELGRVIDGNENIGELTGILEIEQIDKIE